jgi:hypothetical protein
MGSLMCDPDDVAIRRAEARTEEELAELHAETPGFVQRDDLDYPRVTWYVDHEYTHGIKGLACVTDDGRHSNVAGLGPDMVLEGSSAKDCVGALRGMGFTELETDVDELRREWDAWHASSS